ncbi:MAG TPA: glycosyltransferase [Roseiflexaceae bacterium]|nr:glycosyltransferase [Roseiflexaceae bacterium]
MHILYIYKDYYPVLGGIENNLRDLAEGMAERGHTVTVLATGAGRRTQEERPRPGLRVIKAGRALHAASTPLSPAMLRIARGLRPDVAHLHFPYPPGDLAALALPGQPPLVLTYHSDIVRQQTLLRLYRPLLEITLRRAARIFATSPQYIRSSPFLRPHAGKCVVMPSAVDLARFGSAKPAQVAALRAQHRGPLLLFVGRLRYYKGLHMLLDALPQVPATLLIGGTGPERDRLEAQARGLGIAERVRFLGDVADAELPALYQAADVFVLPAHLRAEALGLAQIEALASGTPSVSTELGTGTSFANLHGVTGFVVPPADPAALARALQVLVANPELRRRLGEAGRRRVAELFDLRRMLDTAEQIYHEVATGA